ncbi:MAG: hypothetical protein WD825_17290 [Gemmatimonadaceae bacterium]
MCEWGDTVELAITRRVRVDRCISGAVIRLNAAGVHTTGSCCGHGKSAASVTIYPSCAHRARSLGLVVDVDVPAGGCPRIEITGGNAAVIDALPLATGITGADTRDARS